MPKKPSRQLMQYAGFAAQLAGGLLLAVYAGIWCDKKISLGFPLFIWLLPLLLLIALMIKAVKDTTKK